MGGAEVPPPSQGVPTAPPLPLGGSWPSYVRGLLFWVLAGIGESGEQPPAPLLCVVCLFFRPLPVCPSAPPQPEALPLLDLPTPKGLALGSPGLDVVYGSVVTVPLQNKDCSGLPGPLPPAAWGLGRAGGGERTAPHYFWPAAHRPVFCGLRALRRPTPVCSAPLQYYGSRPPLPRAQCGSRVDVFITKNIY